MIRLGYVGLNTLLPTPNKTFRLKNYSEEKMLEYSSINLDALLNILKWNKNYKILVFRITSNLIPYGSSPINSGCWKSRLADKFRGIGNFIRSNEMIVSLHPGQYTVLNSPNLAYYNNALLDLEYHNSIFELMELSDQHKIVVHGGGGYLDKEESAKTLIERINLLRKPIRERLVLENDDRIFNARDILEICQELHIPAVFDVFHNQILPSFSLSNREIIEQYIKTWSIGQIPEVHYSNQKEGSRPGSHSETVDINQFEKFYAEINDLDLNLILEVKNKQESVLQIGQILKIQPS